MLLLLHGALGDRHTLTPLANALRDAWQVAPSAVSLPALHTLEFEGHGASAPASRPLRLAHFVSQTLAWLEAHGPAHLVGYSMGGYVALVAAARAPDLVRSVFTLGTKLRWSPEIAAEARMQLDPEVMQAKVPAYATQLAERHGAAHWADVVRGTADALRALGEAPLLDDAALSRIRCPVRLTLGDRDRTVPLDELRWCMAQVPSASACVWPDTPHPLDRAPLPLIADGIRAFQSGCRDAAPNPAPAAPHAPGSG